MPSFYVNVDHLVVTKVDVRLALMLTIEVFQSFVTKESYKINHEFDCDSKCIIYLFSYKACELQYVGSTVKRLRETVKGRQHQGMHHHIL